MLVTFLVNWDVLRKQWPTCMKEVGELKEWNSYCHYTSSLIVIEILRTIVLFYCRCISVMYDYHIYFVIVNLPRLLLYVLMVFCSEYWILVEDIVTNLEQWLALSVLYIFALCCPSWQETLLIFPCSLCLHRERYKCEKCLQRIILRYEILTGVNSGTLCYIVWFWLWK
jgi:hypothetical protein